MTQAIDGALNSLNQGLVTGKFNSQQLLQSLAQIGLQLLEHIAIQQIMQAIGHAAQAESVAAAAVTGPAIATAYAPAAAVTSTATFGTSAVTGETAVLAAILAVMGAVVAHEGGELGRGRIRRFHSGGLAHDEVPIIAQENEIMIRKGIAQPFSPFLLALNAGDPAAMTLASMFHGGGTIPHFIFGGRYHDGSREDRSGMTILGVPLGMVEGPSINPNEIDQTDPGMRDTNIEFTSNIGDSPRDSQWLNSLTNFGFAPPIGTPGWLQGPTMIPSMFNPQGYPIAQPVWNNPTDPVGLFHGSQDHINPNKHSGGLITRMHGGGSIGRFRVPSISRMHIGGIMRRIPRMHAGGMTVSGGVSGSYGQTPIAIHNYTDMKALVKNLASSQGRNIIIDTVRGRRIDLGFKK
jgi:hypothetical protein